MKTVFFLTAVLAVVAGPLVWLAKDEIGFDVEGEGLLSPIAGLRVASRIVNSSDIELTDLQIRAYCALYWGFLLLFALTVLLKAMG